MFRVLVGAFCVAAGAVFLFINSIILWRGAVKWAGEDDIEWWAFGLAAALVPWVVAVMPAIMASGWKTVVNTRFGTIRRPSLTVVAVWVAFIAYNIVGGSGAIGFNRQDQMARRAHGADVLSGLKSQREALESELKGLSVSRPAESIQLEADALRTRKDYKNSGECRAPRTKSQRATCQDILRLEGEAVAAARAQDVRKEIAAINDEIRHTSPTVASEAADPQAAIIADVTQLPVAVIQRWLPAATPVILEIGAATMWHFGFLIFGWGIAAPQMARGAVSPVAGYIPSPETMKRAPDTPLDALKLQRELCEYFFRECARPVVSGAMSEGEWYQHYRAVCRRSNAEPLPIEAFHRIAARFVPRIAFIDGERIYFEVLPKIPEDAV